jgi:hypothetical protein
MIGNDPYLCNDASFRTVIRAARTMTVIAGCHRRIIAAAAAAAMTRHDKASQNHRSCNGAALQDFHCINGSTRCCRMLPSSDLSLRDRTLQ